MMEGIERRISQIVHDFSHRATAIYKMIKKTASEVNRELEKMLLDSQELENLEEMRDKEKDLK